MEWMEELEKAVRRAPELDEEEQDGEDEMEQPMDKCGSGMAKSTKGDYAPSDNGDDEDEDTSPKVRDPEALDQANQNPGKKQKMYPKNAGGVKKSLSEDVQDAIDASEVLEGLTKSIDTLASGQNTEIASLRSDVNSLAKGLEVIGKALAKSLETSNQIAKSLSAQVEELGRQPAGRKSTVRKIEKSFGAEGKDPSRIPSKEQRMEKSMAAIQAGKITPVEASIFETHSNRGEFREDLWRKMGGE
jgi:hypothetical protein